MKLIDITPLLLSLLTIIAAIVSYKVVPLLKSLLKEKLTSTQRQMLFEWVKIAVKAAEQLCKDGKLDPDGRKNQVIADVTEWITKKGFTIDFKEIDKMIEAIVSELPKTFNK